MKTSDKLKSVIGWLENPNNELIVAAENSGDEIKLHLIASGLVEAAEALKNYADKIEQIENAESVDVSNLDVVAELAEEFDKDPALQSYASALDELLITIAAPKDWQAAYKKLEDARLDELKRKYQEPKEILDEKNKTAAKDYEKDLKDSPKMKSARILSEPLDSRYCPDHAGAQIMRIGERTWQCSLDGKVYSYLDGFEKLDGTKVPGSSVENQSSVLDNVVPQIFDFTTRQDRYGDKK